MCSSASTALCAAAAHHTHHAPQSQHQHVSAPTTVASDPCTSTNASYSGDLGWRTDFARRFVKGKLLGTGSFGQVFMGVDVHSGKECAVKIMPKVRGKLTKEKTLEKLQREVDILESLQHCKNVIQLEDLFEEAETVAVVTELCSGGDLQQLSDAAGPLSERCLALIAFEVLKVVAACHAAGILHGDVKPANFCLKHANRNPLCSADPTLRTLPWLKAIDFGCSQKLTGTHLVKRSGTPVYMAPEIFARNYSQEADLWSTGVLLYQLYTKRFPFWEHPGSCKATKLEEVAEAVITADIKYNYGPWLKMSAEGRDFIQRCLTRDPSARITADEALKHPWFVKVLNDHHATATASQHAARQRTQAMGSWPAGTARAVPAAA